MSHRDVLNLFVWLGEFTRDSGLSRDAFLVFGPRPGWRWSPQEAISRRACLRRTVLHLPARGANDMPELHERCVLDDPVSVYLAGWRQCYDGVSCQRCGCSGPESIEI
jgi:hypothetical protein